MRSSCIITSALNQSDTWGIARYVRVDERLHEAQEPPGVSEDKVFPHRAGMFPVSEAQTVMVRPAAEEQDDGQEQQSDDSNDLDTCEYELCFTVSFDNYMYHVY